MERERMAYVKATLRADLVRDEGINLTAYRDSVGLFTIGIGHLIGKAEPIKISAGTASGYVLLDDLPRVHSISMDECNAWFELDLTRAEKDADDFIPFWTTLDDVRARAVLNMCFNLGARIGGFINFIAALHDGDWAKAGMELQNSKWAGQVGARAQRLRKMIETGEDT